MGDDFRTVTDDKIINPAIWMARSDAEIAALTPTQYERWQAPYADGSGNPDNDPDFQDFVPPNGGSSNAPIIYSISPDHGPPGTQVTLTGIRFTGSGNIQPPNTLEFNNIVPGRSASFSIVSDTVIKCTVPDGAIDGRIALHSYDPTVPGDVITLSAQSFHVEAGSVTPPPPSPADPSIKVHWDSFDVTAPGSGPIGGGGLTIKASQPMTKVVIDAIIGDGTAMQSGLPVGFFAYTHTSEDNPGTSKSIAINTGLTAVGVARPTLLGEVWVEGTFKIGSKVKKVRRKAKARVKRPYTKGSIVIDHDEYEVVVNPPSGNPIPEFWNEKLFAGATAQVYVKKGTLVGGQFTFSMKSANGSNNSRSVQLHAGWKGVTCWLTAKAVGVGVIDFWSAKIESGNIQIKNAQGQTHTYPLATGDVGALLPFEHGGGMSGGQVVLP
jgi:hypothetical protein